MNKPRQVLRILLVILAGVALPGCAAGVIGLAAAIVGLSGSGGGSDAPDLPPVVAILGTRRFAGGADGSRLLIELRYAVTNEPGDEGQLAVSVAVVRVQTGGTDLDPVETASSFEGCDPLEDVPPGEERCFRWDVRQNFSGAGEVGDVQFIVTATEDGRRQSDPQRSSVVFAGNTPVAVTAERLVGPGPRLDVLFLVADAEGDRARRRGVEVSASGGKWVPLPEELLAALPSDFAAAPEPGLPGTFFFDVRELAGVLGLEALASPGFFGEVAVRFTVEDFPGEGEARGVAIGNVDTNEPPLVEIVSVGLEEPQSGIVPIRYRIFDPDLNPAETIDVEVDLGDGEGFRSALEFPVPPSEGQAGLCTLEPSAPDEPGACAGPAGTRAHTFLWDALAQSAPGFEPAVVTARLSARDPESGPATRAGPRSIRLPLGFSRIREEPAGDGPVALAAADFDQDGFPDLAVPNEFSNSVTFLRGSSAGLTRVREEPAGNRPGALAAADFDQDGSPDLAVPNRDSDNVTYFRQLFLRGHINLVMNPVPPEASAATLLEPRSPPGHELEIPPGALSGPTQIAILPAAPFDIPLALAREAASRGRALVRLTLAASLLPATTTLAAPACLKLRVREGAEDLVTLGLAERSRLRLFRADPATCEVRDVPLDPEDPTAIESIPFGRGRLLVPGLRFPITRFGSYVVAVEVDRANEP